MEELTNGLNDRQRQAVTHREDDVLQVLAGPGTGKTKVLTARFAYLVIEKKIHPLRIIMTTFTRKAANEIKERLQPILSQAGISSNGLLIGTFHSICARLLRQAGHLIGIPKNWSIAKTEDINTILKTLLEETPVEIIQPSTFTTELSETRTNVRFLRTKISDLKAKGVTPQAYLKDQSHDSAIQYIYERFQDTLLSEALLDFDDILLYSKILLMQRRIWSFVRHVLVDEYQDTNELQLDLIYLLARGNHDKCSGITVVGDPDQSIYAFRFASSDNFTKLIDRCPVQSARISLIDNYRSAQTLLDFSEKVIGQQMKNRIKRDPLRAQFNHNVKPFYSYFQRTDTFENSESNALAHEILYLKSLPGLFKFSDVSILLRTRRQVYDIEKALIKNRIPYRIVNAKGVWEKKESGIFLDYLRIISQDSCSLAILRCLQFASNGIGSTTIRKIKSAFDKDHRRNSLDVLKEFCESNDLNSQKISAALKRFINLIEKLKLKCEECETYDGLKELFAEIYMLGELHSVLKISKQTINEQIKDRSLKEFLQTEHQNMFKVYELFTEYELDQNDEHITIQENAVDPNVITLMKENFNSNDLNFFEIITFFTKSISLYSSEEENTENSLGQLANHVQDRVTVSTIHAAKGLEWPVVFIPSINEGLIPFTDQSARQRLEDLAELRRDGEACNNFNNYTMDSDGFDNIKEQLRGKESDLIDDLETTLNEERRIFFVALTRAKDLLYLSSSGKKSIFLKNCEQLYSNNVLFNNPQSILRFYRCMNRTLEETSSKFSLKSLCQDYQKSKNCKTNTFIWNGTNVQTLALIDFNNNTAPSRFSTGTNSFKPASSFLNTSFSPGKNDHNSGTANVTKVLATSSKECPKPAISKICEKKRRITLDMLCKKPVKNSQSMPSKKTRLESSSAQDVSHSISSDGRTNHSTKVAASRSKSFAPAYTPVRNNAKRVKLKTNATAKAYISK
ncbi:hypothetical protein KDRO_F04580 [Kluyveromyces lactis]|nr:hypothetical protein KDRO_F04580 [Kluyveromyces lactis]